MTLSLFLGPARDALGSRLGVTGMALGLFPGAPRDSLSLRLDVLPVAIEFGICFFGISGRVIFDLVGVSFGAIFDSLGILFQVQRNLDACGL